MFEDPRHTFDVKLYMGNGDGDGDGKIDTLDSRPDWSPNKGSNPKSDLRPNLRFYTDT